MKGDLKEGKGLVVSANGDVYTGDWVADMRAGQGRCQYASGDVYVGQWANGERSGLGECTFASGDTYTGHWLRDNMEGAGAMTGADRSPRPGLWIDGISCSIEDISSDGYTPLMLAVKANKVDAVIHLTSVKGSDVNKKEKNRRRTAMMFAVQNNNATVVELLCKVPELNLSMRDVNGDTALCLAASLGFVNIGALLLSKASPKSAFYTSKNVSKAVELYSILTSLKMVEMRRMEIIGEMLSPGQRECYGSNEEVSRICDAQDAIERYGSSTRLRSFWNTPTQIPTETTLERLDSKTAKQKDLRVQRGYGSKDVYRIIEYGLNVKEVCHAYFLNTCLKISVDLSKPEIFDNEVIDAAVDHAWKSYGFAYHVQLTAAYIILLALVTVDNYTYNAWIVSSNSTFANANVFIESAILLLNSWFVFLELCQLYHASTDSLLNYYFGDIFNYIDWTSFSFLYAGIILRILHKEETYLSSSLMSISTVMLWLNFLYFLRPFRAIFYVFVKLIFSVATDIKEVIAILLIVIYGFSQSFYLLSYADKSLMFSDPIQGILTAYKAILTSFSFEDIEQTSNPALGVFLLSVYIALTAILILNLLIAVMNSSYNAIQSTQRAEWNRVRCKVMLSQVRFTHAKTYQYTTCIMREDDRLFQNNHSPDAFESRLRSYIDGVNEENKNENRALRESILEVYSELGIMKQNSKSIDSKLDAILSALSTKPSS